MALKLELNMKLAQQLVMTPQLQMAIKLLQLTKMELQELVNQELQENPTLEEAQYDEIDPSEPDVTPDIDTAAEELIPKVQTEGEAPAKDELVASDLENSLKDAQPTEPEMDWDSYFDTYMDGPSDIMPRDTGGDEKANLEQYYAEENGLHDYLLWQLKLSSIPDETQDICQEIIGNINEDGYLKDISLEEISERMDRSIREVEGAHQRVLRFDPVGVGARDLRECLLAQIRFNMKSHPLLLAIVQSHWELVKKRDIPKLARQLKVGRSEVEDAMRLLTELNPRPGLQYSTIKAEYISPDIYVVKVGDEYHILLNEDGMPRLRLSSYYQRALMDKDGSSETREYIKGKLRSATWLIRSIQQRQRTIYKVTESIVKKQREFLDHGVQHLKPMVLRDVAEDIGMHECTVSRVTTSKYVHTPQGVFELKYFFNSGIINSDGEGVSSESIKNKIKQLIDKENPKKPLSDQKLVAILKEDDVIVARRTVAKYRESLGLLSSSGRRKTY